MVVVHNQYTLRGLLFVCFSHRGFHSQPENLALRAAPGVQTSLHKYPRCGSIASDQSVKFGLKRAARNLLSEKLDMDEKRTVHANWRRPLAIAASEPFLALLPAAWKEFDARHLRQLI